MSKLSRVKDYQPNHRARERERELSAKYSTSHHFLHVVAFGSTYWEEKPILDVVNLRPEITNRNAHNAQCNLDGTKDCIERTGKIAPINFGGHDDVLRKETRY
jgi:hypothetical protein